MAIVNLESKYSFVHVIIDRELWQQTVSNSADYNSICFTRSEMTLQVC